MNKIKGEKNKRNYILMEFILARKRELFESGFRAAFQRDFSRIPAVAIITL